jgi:polyisoprenoid-binding protein YceI
MAKELQEAPYGLANRSGALFGRVRRSSHDDLEGAGSKVRGRFERFSGTVDADEQNPVAARIDVQIDVASITTNEPTRDAHLKSPDFFDVATYPYITFKSKRVEQFDANSGRVIGDLTMRDQTHEVTLDIEYQGQSKSPWGTTSAGFSAVTKINRKDWGLGWNVALETGGVLVGDEISIAIEVELAKVVEAPQEAASAPAA